MPLALPPVLFPSLTFVFLSFFLSLSPPSPLPTAADVARGEKIFKTKCAQCHVAEKGGGHKQVSVSTMKERENRMTPRLVFFFFLFTVSFSLFSAFFRCGVPLFFLHGSIKPGADYRVGQVDF